MSGLPDYSVKENVVNNPHVVILGAGASKAAYPMGDKGGNPIPLMKDLVRIIGLERELEELNIINHEDFESVFDYIYNEYSHTEQFVTIKRKIYNYFSELLPTDALTIYDKLVLSLREKDVIATFNWDPFLGMAFQRNRWAAKLPQLLFLHGNVFWGICEEHKTMGFMNCACSKCGNNFKPSELLYPIKQKEYNQIDYLKFQWDTLRFNIKIAYLITIFGYSAPKTDVEARKIFLESYQENCCREQSQIEIIDIQKKHILDDTWNEFFYKDHYEIHKRLCHSWLSIFPRRSCEAFASTYMQCKPWHEPKVNKIKSYKMFKGFIESLLVSEKHHEKNSAIPLSKY